MEKNLNLPKDLIVFISGVPGVGKTTISYELLKRHSDFRIIEETDLLRDALRGYSELLRANASEELLSLLNEFKIYSNQKLLTLSDAANQCSIMKRSIEHIVARQQRKGIPSIINGVHIVPAVLADLTFNPHIIFVNLYVDNCDTLYRRLLGRHSRKDMLEQVYLLYKTNKDLFESTAELGATSKCFFNIDVTMLNIDETIDRIIHCVKLSVNHTA